MREAPPHTCAGCAFAALYDALRDTLALGLKMATETGPFPDYEKRDAFVASARAVLGEKDGGK